MSHTDDLSPLLSKQTEQSQLNLTFNERDELIFTVTGSKYVSPSFAEFD